MTRIANGSEPPEHDGGDTSRQDRGCVAVPSPLHRILAPRTVTVVGAGPRHGEAGHETLRALRDYGFHGRLYAVNPSGRPVCGIPAYRCVAALPAPVDLLVLAVPVNQVARVLTDAGPLGAHGAVLLDTDLFGDEPATARLRQEILQVARRRHIRLLGPASLGILNTDPNVRLNASLSPARPPTGGLALAVRSGAVGVTLLADAVREHCGVSTLVSLGDEIDLTAADLLTHWLDDPTVGAVALSPEPFAEPDRLARLAWAVGRHKPVLTVAGAPAADDRLARAGVLRTASFSEILDTARMLINQPLPAGNRMAVVGNAGALTALAARTARAHGFEVVPVGEPQHAGNPMNLDPDTLPARIADAAETAATSGAVDILLLILVGTRANTLAATMSAMAPVLDAHAHLTAAAVVTDGTGAATELGRRGAPVFREPEQAVRALAHARDYATWRRDPLSRRPWPTRLDLRPDFARPTRIVLGEAAGRHATTRAGAQDRVTAGILDRSALPVVP